MALATQTIDGIDVIEINVKALDADSVGEIRKHLDATIAENPKVVLDLTGLNFIDSSGLGALISSLRQAKAAGGDLKLCNLSKPVRAMFELVRMHKVIDLLDTRADALGSF